MAEKLGLSRDTLGPRFVFADAGLSAFDLSQLEAAFQSALKPLDPAIGPGAVSVFARQTSDGPKAVEVAIVAANIRKDAAPVAGGSPVDPRVDGSQRITVDRDQYGGRPCPRGLRIRMRGVLDLLAAGADRSEIRCAVHSVAKNRGPFTIATEQAREA